MIVVAGDAKVDNHRYKMAFHEKAHMIPAPDVERLTGHVPGGVCPFALKDGVTLYFDESLTWIIHEAESATQNRPLNFELAAFFAHGKKLSKHQRLRILNNVFLTKNKD